MSSPRRLPPPVEPPLPVADEPLPDLDPAMTADVLDQFATQDMAGNPLAAPEDLGAYYQGPEEPVPTEEMNVPRTGMGFDMSRLAVQTKEDFQALEPEVQDLLRYLKTGVEMTEAGMAEYVIERREERRKEQSPTAVARREQLTAQTEALQRQQAEKAQATRDSIGTMRGVVNEILQHPGFSGSVGAKNQAYLFGLKSQPFAGSKEADFMAMLAQLEGGAFLQAFQALKGGGPITDVEGQKATQAIARAQTAQSEAGFKKSMNDLMGILDTAERRLGDPKAPAQAGAAAPEAAARPAAAPAASRTMSAAEFKAKTGRDLAPGRYQDSNGRPITILP